MLTDKELNEKINDCAKRKHMRTFFCAFSLSLLGIFINYPDGYIYSAVAALIASSLTLWFILDTTFLRLITQNDLFERGETKYLFTRELFEKGKECL